MSAVQKTLEDVAKTLSKQIAQAVTNVASRHGVADADALTQDLLVQLGLVELKVSVVKTKSVKSEGEGSAASGRKRVVSNSGTQLIDWPTQV